MRLAPVILVPFALLLAEVSGFHELHTGRTREPVQIIPKSRRAVQVQWIEQRLDHFNPRDLRTWQMRYMCNDEHFKPGGHIVIHIGGEWTITEGTLLGGQTYDIAKQHNAYMFYTEHRYYGNSRPTADTSTKNLQYLSVDQALADLAYFVQHVKKTIPGLSNSKVAVIGGSYAGSMAAWFRLKYPHLVDAALASSAPLLAVADFYKYYEVVGTALRTVGGIKCYEVVEKAMKQLREQIQRKGGPQTIANMFNLCSPIEPDESLDFGNFLSSISGIFAGIVQYHKKGDIEYICEYLTDTAVDNTELFALAEFARTRWGAACADMEFQSTVNAYKDIEWDTSSTAGSIRQWFYQTCTEYGYYQTDTSIKQPFGTGANTLELYLEMCKGLYEDASTENAGEILNTGIARINITYLELNDTNVKFSQGTVDSRHATDEILNTGIARTNILYGALDLNVTRVIFTHGTVDPWHAIGVLEDVNEDAPTIVVPGTSHCKDLQSISSTDSEEMKAAKQRIQQLVAEWLK